MIPDPLHEILNKYLNGSSIFTNRDSLRHEFVPSALPHREEEILRIGAILGPCLRGQKPSNIFIYGKPGTGKTAVCRYATARVSKAASVSPRVHVAYVNCRTAGTAYRVAADLAAAVGLKVPFTGLATAEVMSRFRSQLDDNPTCFLAVMDEVDTMVNGYGDTMLYELTRVNERLCKSNVTVVGISNDLGFKQSLEPRVLSSLSEEEVVFRPYTADQLVAILRARCDSAFREGALGDSALNLCAGLAAAEHGDARRALDLIRVAGELAERGGDSQITDTHVREAERKMETDKVSETIGTLPLHSKLIIRAVMSGEKAKGTTTGQLYATYLTICKTLGISELTYRRVSALLTELNTLGILSAQLTNMGRYGRTKRIQVAVDTALLESHVSEDKRFEPLYY